MATGDAGDFTARLRSVLPGGWFPASGTGQASASPVLDAVLAGLSASWAQVYALLAYAGQQTRIVSATDVFLDMIALDYFGTGLRRRVNEADAGLRVRVGNELLRPRNTRAALVRALVNLTGRTPVIFEPGRATDTGAYGTASAVPWAYNADFGFSKAGPEWTFQIPSTPAYAAYSAAGVRALGGAAVPAINGPAWTAVVEWVGGSGNGIIFGANDGASFASSLYAAQSGGNVGLTMFNAAGLSISIPNLAINSGAFATNRVVISVSPGSFSLSVNGGAVHQAAYAGTLPTYAQITLGCSPWAHDNLLTAAITRLTIYPSARSAGDMQKLSVVGYQPGHEVVPAPWVGLAYDVTGAYGSLALPFQAFVTALRPIGKGIAFLPGYGASTGAYGVPSLSYASIAQSGGQVTDAEIYATIANTMPAGTIAWTNIASVAPVGAFTLDASTLDSGARLV